MASSLRALLFFTIEQGAKKKAAVSVADVDAMEPTSAIASPPTVQEGVKPTSAGSSFVGPPPSSKVVERASEKASKDTGAENSKVSDM